MVTQASHSAEADRRFMQQAIEVAQRARFNTSPNPGVGCVLVRHGEVIAEGWTQPPGQAHAEIEALARCEDAHGATAYVTLEPCAHQGRTGPCCEALIEAGIVRVVAALQDPFEPVQGKGLARLRESGIDVEVGVCADEARELHAGFLSRIERDRPWVTVKVAASLDGATALSNGESQWITDASARADVHWLRAECDAVITGSGTVISDDPQLTARVDSDKSITQPRAIVLDSELRSPPEAQVFQRDSLVFTRANVHPPAGHAYEHATLSPASDGCGLDLNALMTALRPYAFNHVLVEAGAALSGAFIRSGLVDRLVVYQAPRLMGAQARGMFDLGELTGMDQVIDLVPVSQQRVGTCTKWVFGFA